MGQAAHLELRALWAMQRVTSGREAPIPAGPECGLGEFLACGERRRTFHPGPGTAGQPRGRQEAARGWQPAHPVTGWAPGPLCALLRKQWHKLAKCHGRSRQKLWNGGERSLVSFCPLSKPGAVCLPGPGPTGPRENGSKELCLSGNRRRWCPGSVERLNQLCRGPPADPLLAKVL